MMKLEHHDASWRSGIAKARLSRRYRFADHNEALFYTPSFGKVKLTYAAGTSPSIKVCCRGAVFLMNLEGVLKTLNHRAYFSEFQLGGIDYWRGRLFNAGSAVGGQAVCEALLNLILGECTEKNRRFPSLIERPRTNTVFFLGHGAEVPFEGLPASRFAK